MQSDSASPTQPRGSSEPKAENQPAPLPELAGVRVEKTNAAPKPSIFSFQTILAIIIFVLMLVVLTGVSGLGYWVYRLKTDLAAREQSLTALQKKYDGLTVEFGAAKTELEQVKSELEKTKSELEQTRTDLSRAQADLTNSKKEVTNLRARIKKAGIFLEALIAALFEGDSSPRLANTAAVSGDSRLQELASAFKQNPVDENFGDLLLYIFEVLVDLLS